MVSKTNLPYLVTKINVIFANELEKIYFGKLKDTYIIKALEVYRRTLTLKYEERIPEFWTILTILSENLDVKELFKKYLPEKINEVKKFSEIRGAWHHFKSKKKNFDLVKESKELQKCTEDILLGIINEEYRKILELKN